MHNFTPEPKLKHFQHTYFYMLLLSLLSKFIYLELHNGNVIVDLDNFNFVIMQQSNVHHIYKGMKNQI